MNQEHENEIQPDQPSGDFNEQVQQVETGTLKETRREVLPYIEFIHGKLGMVKKVKWDPEIGEPIHGEKFIYRDEFGEDWGIVLRPISEPESISEIEEQHAEEETDEMDEPLTHEEGVINGIAVKYFTTEDEAALAQIQKDEAGYLVTCRERIAHHGLRMKLLATDIRFDRRKITFHFAAEGRVDFRMLVRDLASIFRCRIELHQIGARDEAKLYVGCGPCGRNLCCRSWLSGFQPIGIRMARAQNLPLNPGKISGNCGRLLCCLEYEFENYLELAETLPRVGDRKEFEGVPYEVTYVSPLSQTLTVQCLDEEERHRRLKITSEEYYSGIIVKKK